MAANDLAEFVISRHLSHMTQAGESGDENVYKSSLIAKVFAAVTTKMRRKLMMGGVALDLKQSS